MSIGSSSINSKLCQERLVLNIYTPEKLGVEETRDVEVGLEIRWIASES